uniref:Uncharacterized protein n=1 Tax=Oryza brachyantha TaxID=4533 RepID=J3M9M0_ORYBR
SREKYLGVQLAPTLSVCTLFTAAWLGRKTLAVLCGFGLIADVTRMVDCSRLCV